MRSLLMLIPLFATVPSPAVAADDPAAVSTCSLIANPGAYVGRDLTIEGDYVFDGEIFVLQGPDCPDEEELDLDVETVRSGANDDFEQRARKTCLQLMQDSRGIFCEVGGRGRFSGRIVQVADEYRPGKYWLMFESAHSVHLRD